MKKKEFLDLLEMKLNGLPREEKEEKVSFYDEMIQDMMEDGRSEEEAVESLGSFNEVVTKIAGETKMSSLVKERIKPKRRISALEIVLLILGFPLWFPLMLVFLILFFVGWMLVWVLVLVTYSVEAALLTAGGAGLIHVLFNLKEHSFYYGDLGISILMIGAALLFLVACIYATKATIKLTKVIVLKFKSHLIGGKKNA